MVNEYTTAYARLVQDARRRPPQVAVILGSGLSGLGDRLSNAVAVPFLEVPGLSGTTVPGHQGSILLGDWAEVPVLIFAGRLHFYEGHSWRSVTEPIQAAHDLGVRTLIVTNAAGGIRDDLVPSSLMALTSHLDWTHGEGCRQQGGTDHGCYDAGLRQALREAARSLGFELTEGVYAQVTGPCYETKAEIRALRACGADAVGMSTGREIRAGHRLGLRCAALSCITNRAAGLNTGPIHHEEVLETTARTCARLGDLIEAFLKEI